MSLRTYLSNLNLCNISHHLILRNLSLSRSRVFHSPVTETVYTLNDSAEMDV